MTPRRISLLMGFGCWRAPLRRQLLNIYVGTASCQWTRMPRFRRSYSDEGCGTFMLENTFRCYDLEPGPPMDVELSREDAISMFTKMVEIRRLENACANLYKEQKIRGFCHLYIGQEAIAVGMHAAMRKMDTVITAYRCHGWTYLMGVSLYAIIAELVGVRSGCSRGKGGSMHLYSNNYFGGNGIVGAQVPLGAGVALAHRYRDDGGVCITCYGDGAANQGQIFEAYNMAKLWCLPCIFVCENNVYGMGTKIDRSSAMTEYYMRGQYIPGLWVDGNQVLAVRSAAQFAYDYAQRKGPIVLEMKTYRFMGHSMSDPGTSYRSRQEVQKMRETGDPITVFRKQITALGLAKEQELTDIEKRVKAESDKSIKKALSQREVELFELTADVYSKNLEPKIRGISGYNLDHMRLSDICGGKLIPTAASEIKDVPVGDAALAAQMAAAKAEAAKAAAAKASAKKPAPAKPAATKPAADAKSKPPAKKEAKPTDKKPATPTQPKDAPKKK